MPIERFKISPFLKPVSLLYLLIQADSRPFHSEQNSVYNGISDGGRDIDRLFTYASVTVFCAVLLLLRFLHKLPLLLSLRISEDGIVSQRTIAERSNNPAGSKYI